MQMITQARHDDTFQTLQDRLNQQIKPNRYKIKLEVTKGGADETTGTWYDLKVIVLDHLRRFVDSADYNYGDAIYLNAKKGMLG